MGAPEALNFLDSARWTGRVYSPNWSAPKGGAVDVMEPATGTPMAA